MYGALLRLQDERAQLLRLHGYATDNAGMLLLIRDAIPLGNYRRAGRNAQSSLNAVAP